MIPCERRRPDADLVREALLGSREALAELLTRHWDTAVFLAARVLQSTELARDAAQEAAIAAMTDLGRLRSPERFGAWFCGIALNVARRWLRQLRPELPGLPPDRASPAPGPAGSPPPGGCNLLIEKDFHGPRHSRGLRRQDSQPL